MYISLDGKKLRAKTYECGLSQRKLASATGISYSWLNGVFSGRRCSEESAHQIAKALGTTVEELT